MHNEMSEGILNMLSQSFEQNTIAWILISIGLGALLTESIKFIFENNLPEWKKRKATKIAIQKYSYPLLLTSYCLSLTLSEFLTNIKVYNKAIPDFTGFDKKSCVDPKDDYLCLNTLYEFGCFVGWSRMLEKEAFIELSLLYEQKGEVDFKAEVSWSDYQEVKVNPVGRKTTWYMVYIYGIINPSSIKDIYFQEMYEKVFNSISTDTWISASQSDKTIIPNTVLDSMGDSMMTYDKERKNLINFFEFVKKYNDDIYFRKCFSYIVNTFSEIQPSPNNSRWHMLVMFYTNLHFFHLFLKRAPLPRRRVRPFEGAEIVEEIYIPFVDKNDIEYYRRHENLIFRTGRLDILRGFMEMYSLRRKVYKAHSKKNN
jgi:hypothetical protein